MTSKVIRWKMNVAEVDKRRIETVYERSLTKQNGEWGKKHYQPMMNNHRDGKTWADVVRSGGIKIQIVLGNGNLSQATMMKRR
jgi:hypothetical protein